MRLACRIAIAFGLILPAASMASQQPDPAGSAKSAAQTPATPSPQENPPAESPPANPPTPTPTEEKKATESVAKEKTVPDNNVPASRTTKRRKRSPRAAASNGAPRRTVIREGGASEPAAQIVPGMTPAEATRQRQDAEQWLASANDQLKQLAGHTLGARRQETVAQIRNYMDGARSALKEGDVRRANTLAEKAHLLAEDLVQH